jgi:hypothetical protein
MKQTQKIQRSILRHATGAGGIEDGSPLSV